MKFDKREITNIPTHIAFIMDGNGRWANKRLLPRNFGHKEGVKTMRLVIRECVDMGIKVISIYALSTENIQRPKNEVDALKSLIKENIYDMLKELIEEGVKVRYMGDLSFFESDIRAELDRAEKESAHGEKAIINIGLNYGARDEIVQAVNRCVQEGRQVTVEEFSEKLYTAGLPEPDLIVRTGGEFRLSNFMLFQAAYSEVVVRDVLWPDFGKKELYDVLSEFSKRNRRFGKV